MENEMSELLVLENDYGIRPAGKPNECFYCFQKVGQFHKYNCVIVCKRVQYVVKVAGQNVVVGTFESDDPYFWDSADCEFNKNDSSWCADNAVESIKWLDTPEAKSMKIKLENLSPIGECACGVIDFEFDKVILEGPFRRHS